MGFIGRLFYRMYQMSGNLLKLHVIEIYVTEMLTHCFVPLENQMVSTLMSWGWVH